MKKKLFVICMWVVCSSPLFAETGKEIFDRFCVICHSQTMAPVFSSPAVHDVKAWNERKKDAFSRFIESNKFEKNFSEIEKDECSINELVKSAINGTDKGMPPKGTCSDCTDDELKSVIMFMSSEDNF